MGWLSIDWKKRIKLTIDQTKIDTAAQLNFPVLVHLSTTSGITNADVSCVFDELTADGNRKKIAVTLSDGTTECYVEIERWDDANEKAWLWVKVPSVAYDVDTDLYLYYDSDHADNDTYVGDTTDAVTHNVWDSDFVGVWHMAQDPNGDAANAIKDSTSYAHDGTPGGTMVTADLVDGQIGKAINFDVTDDHINVGNVSEIGSQSAVTWEATVKNAAGAADHAILGKWDTDHQIQIWMDAGNDKWQAIVQDDDVSAETLMVQPGLVAPNGAWQYVVCVLDGQDLNLYVDLVDGGSDNNVDFAGGLHDIVADLYIGADNNNDHNFGNDIDEVRISKIARSQPWRKATHHSNTDALVTFGSEELITATGLFDGKVCISPTVDQFDGKAAVKDSTSDQFDGKSVVALASEDEFDGKIQIKDVTTIQFDGKAAVKNIATDQFDGKVWLYPARDLFDGKIWIKELIEGSVDLPSLGITGNTGGVGDLTLPFFEVLGEVSVGIDAQGNITLPGLGVAGFTGATCSYNLPSLGVSGTSVVGIAASGDVVLPIFGVDGQAFTDALVHGVFTLPALNVVANSIAGALCIGEVTLPRLGISATAKVGVICTGAVTLPCLIVEGDSGHIPIGDGEITLPLLKVYSTASVLADPRDGCHVLRHNRWR